LRLVARLASLSVPPLAVGDEIDLVIHHIPVSGCLMDV
jgi:hypothetical protein